VQLIDGPAPNKQVAESLGEGVTKRAGGDLSV